MLCEEQYALQDAVDASGATLQSARASRREMSNDACGRSASRHGADVGADRFRQHRLHAAVPDAPARSGRVVQLVGDAGRELAGAASVAVCFGRGFSISPACTLGMLRADHARVTRRVGNEGR